METIIFIAVAGLLFYRNGRRISAGCIGIVWFLLALFVLVILTRA